MLLGHSRRSFFKIAEGWAILALAALAAVYVAATSRHSMPAMGAGLSACALIAAFGGWILLRASEHHRRHFNR